MAVAYGRQIDTIRAASLPTSPAMEIIATIGIIYQTYSEKFLADRHESWDGLLVQLVCGILTDGNLFAEI